MLHQSCYYSSPFSYHNVLVLKYLFYSLIQDQCMESSLQEWNGLPARTVSYQQEPEYHCKDEPKECLDPSKFQLLSLCLSLERFQYEY